MKVHDDVHQMDTVLIELEIGDNGFDFDASIVSARQMAEAEKVKLEETIESVKLLRPECDRTDYVLAACSGALCGVFDVFLVGKPGESIAGEMTDAWIGERVIDFAKCCKWQPQKEATLSRAISFLERKFEIPYDQTSWGQAGREIFDTLTTGNHHFKSLGHHPSLCGLFFSILDQWCNTSHFVSNGELITLHNAGKEWELKGHTVAGKLFSGFVNWLGHIISDLSGSSGSTGRGMGLPTPFWSWTNEVIAIKKELQLPTGEFDRAVNDLALNIFKNGFDTRFTMTQAIPVVVNELIVRTFYAVRRLFKFFSTKERERSFARLWKACEPFSNPTVQRMLTVAHGTFFLVDASDAAIHGLTSGTPGFNPIEFFLRLNVVGVGRMTICLYGEGKRAFALAEAKGDAKFAEKEKQIIEYYIEGLRILEKNYDDQHLIQFVEDFKKSDAYQEAFAKSAELARLRNVPEDRILINKEEIDNYFGKES